MYWLATKGRIAGIARYVTAGWTLAMVQLQRLQPNQALNTELQRLAGALLTFVLPLIVVASALVYRRVSCTVETRIRRNLTMHSKTDCTVPSLLLQLYEQD
jgi:hypothetical protein